MNIKWIFFRGLRYLLRKMGITKYNWKDESRVDLADQLANDYVYSKIEESLVNKRGLLVTKFGTTELDAVWCYLKNQKTLKCTDYLEYISGKGIIFPEETLPTLCNNAGFFPSDLNLQKQFCSLVVTKIPEIDILASYTVLESCVDDISNAKRINIEGYCAPFKWNNPWTRLLKGKKVLVVHPFVDSIKEQYEKRNILFENPDVLPEFEKLILVKAVQSIACNGKNTNFRSWFDALKSMEDEIDKHEYDIAIVGCGAYGFPLAAHCKEKGKIAIHMAGWTQMLFGIYGNRWVKDQPEYKKYINDYWIRPLKKDRPKGLEKVENGAYW